MSPDKSPFPLGWPFSELAGYRQPPEHSTYTYFPYNALPPLPDDQFRGEFQWLASQPNSSNVDDDEVEYWNEYLDSLRSDGPSKLASLQSEAERLCITIPQSFFAFMGNVDLIGRIRSCTDCGFELSKRIAPKSNGDGYFIHFLSDSQGCLFWNLFITPTGDHCVVSSWKYFGDAYEDTEGIDDESEGIVYCASSFESFLYRFWLENEIWFQLSLNKAPLTELQQRYVNHYRRIDA